jgi:hypothetical protein
VAKTPRLVRRQGRRPHLQRGAARRVQLDVDERAHIEQLKATEGSFKGQAIFGRGTELGEAMDDAQYGKHEIAASVPEPVLYEMTLEYLLFSDQDFYKGVPPGAHIQFSGTLVALEFQDSAKPRKLTMKVKASSVERLK